MRFTSILVFLAFKAVADSLPGLPTVPYTPTGGTLPSASLARIIVSSEFAEFVDNAGQTLIPPTLHSFATTFASDLASVVGLDIPVELGATAEQGSIFLTLGDASLYRDAAGRETSEGYSLNVTVDGVLISGASPLGVWWGTRTLLQQLVLDGGEVKLGYGVDSPGWGIRGMMVSVSFFFRPRPGLEPADAPPSRPRFWGPIPEPVR